MRAFYKNIITAETLGISKVVINKSLAENDNRQRIVEMFRRLRENDVDHIMPKSILEEKEFEWNKINSIENYQLIDYGTNRGTKNGKPFAEWINNSDYVKDKSAFMELHLIPQNEELWDEDKFLETQELI